MREWYLKRDDMDGNMRGRIRGEVVVMD